MNQWYESLFENYAQKYDKECFVQGTPGECDFIENEVDFNKDIRIIDIGCGTGRHSIELSKRGCAFPLMETDEMNSEILKNVTRALKDDGEFIFTILNGLFALYHSVEKFCESAGKEDNAGYRNNTFDLMTFRDHHTTTFEDDSGNKKALRCDERYYVPSETTWLLKTLGCREIDIFGAKLGAFSRGHKLTTEDFEMLVADR